jgi:hypothetical protein
VTPNIPFVRRSRFDVLTVLFIDLYDQDLYPGSQGLRVD